MIELIGVEKGINDGDKKAMNPTFIVNSPTSSLERIVHSKLRSSASGIIGSQAPEISKSYIHNSDVSQWTHRNRDNKRRLTACMNSLILPFDITGLSLL